MMEEIQQGINQLLGVDSQIRKKRKTPKDKNKELFSNLFIQYEILRNRSQMLDIDFGISTDKFEEGFWNLIDNFIVFHFGKENSQIIFDYLDRPNEIFVIYKNGLNFYIQNYNELFEYISNSNNEKK